MDGTDFGAFGNSFNATMGVDVNYDAAFDFNPDGTINGGDFGEFGNRFGLTL